MTNDNVRTLKINRGSYSTLRQCMLDVMGKYPDASCGIVVVFDGEGDDMYTYFRANDQQLSYASVRLAAIADRGEI